jgi:hypothetical protein
MKIHLGIIVGNETSMIARFLDSFQKHVDSISVVRACGNQPPDDTLDIARARGCLVAEYHNAPAGQDWPHVDNFAAARNQSFAMAPEGTDWLMWADADDLLTESGEQILAELRAGTLDAKDAIYAPYITSAGGSFARRMRLVRPIVYKGWINAIHEDIEVAEGTHAAWCQEMQVLHLPATNKRGSVQRNRRILEAIPEDQRTGREWWFLFRECEIVQDIAAMLHAALIATGRADLGDEEKFMAYLSIGRWIKDITDAERPLLEAVRLRPSRREGYAELAKLHLARGDAEKALAYARAMDGLPRPDLAAWTHDESLYGWRHHDLLTVSLSAAGLPQEAAAARKAWRKNYPPRIAVGHPTCRPEKALATRNLWLERAAKPERVAYFFGIEPTETSRITHYPHAVSEPVPEGHASAVANYNAAAAAAAGSGAKVFVMSQDDIYPPHGWDEQILAAFKDKMDRPTALHLHDGFRGPNDPLMVIMCYNWRWWLGRDWLLNPAFDGYWSDTAYSWETKKAGVVVDARHIHFYHDHPAFTGAESDVAYMRQQNPIAERRGREVFARLYPEAVAAGW